MSYIDAGALDISLDTIETDIPTKKALKEKFRDNPNKVLLYTTSELSPQKHFTSDMLVIGEKYSVVGPNPYTSRKWYATVERTEKGITVK